MHVPLEGLKRGNGEGGRCRMTKKAFADDPPAFRGPVVEAMEAMAR